MVAVKNSTDVTSKSNEAESASALDRVKPVGEKIDDILNAIKALVSIDSCSSDTRSNAPGIFLDDIHKA